MNKHKKNLSKIQTPSGIVSSSSSSPICTTQFGASLQFIKENNGGDPIPPIVRQCIDFLKTPEGKYSQSNNLALHKLNFPLKMTDYSFRDRRNI